MHPENSIRGRFGTDASISITAVHNSPFWKRTMDVVFILLALPVLAPLMVAIAVYIKLVSRGPVFFKQKRVGYLGGTFICYKFRSMTANADVSNHREHTTDLIRRSDIPMRKLDKTDARVIPGGAWLRASGLDELPQLLNILRGEMSLVGPRPCVPYEYDQYLPWQRTRFDVAPGLTGLWQVNGKNQTTFNEMIEMDILYGRTRSLWLDLRIILKTVPAVIEQVRFSRVARRQSATRRVSVRGGAVEMQGK